MEPTKSANPTTYLISSGSSAKMWPIFVPGDEGEGVFLCVWLKKKKNRIYAIVYACLLIFTLCTLPAAPVSKSFGLCSSFESVLLTPTKVPGTNFFDC